MMVMEASHYIVQKSCNKYRNSTNFLRSHLLRLCRLPALQARTCSGREPQSAANFFTLFKSDRSSSQISTLALFAMDFFAISAFSVDLQAITMVHWSVVASAFTAAKPMPRLAPVTITVLLAALRLAAEASSIKDDSRQQSMQMTRILTINFNATTS